MVDNFLALIAAKNKQQKKATHSTSFIQLEIIKLLKKNKDMALTDLVLETGLSASKTELQLRKLL